MSHAATAHELMTAAIGTPEGSSSWLTIDQARITAFADVTGDHQFIHVDPERAAKESPWGKTIAHGLLTLSLLPVLLDEIPKNPAFSDGVVMGINYGFDKVRFLNPVVVDSKVRASSTISAAELKGSNVSVTRTMTVEIEGQDKPALVAEWIVLMAYAD